MTRRQAVAPLSACLLSIVFCRVAISSPAPPSAAASLSAVAQSTSSAPERALDPVEGREIGGERTAEVTAYTLPPEKYKKARDFNRIADRFYFIDFVYGLLVLLFILRARLGPRYRNWAERCSSNLLLQSVIFAPLLLFTVDLLELPPRIYRHMLAARYGLSVQRWPSWFRDWSKEQLLTFIFGACVVCVLYAIMRRSPRRWWLYFWLAALPFAVFVVFLQPLVVDPLFNNFEPLETGHPALVQALERTVERAGLRIPPERMFEMKASEKTTELNAYVTGLGGSKRVVVFDTTMARMTEPQIVLVFGHEMGHYVLGHVYLGLLFGLAAGLPLLFLGYRALDWMLRRWGQSWSMRGASDLASLPAVLLLLTLGEFLITPAANAASRYLEHQADVYGLEVTHGLVPDSSGVMAQAFQVLGEVDLEDPAPSPLVKFWLYSHPWIGDRIRFALTYNPWAAGHSPEFVK